MPKEPLQVAAYAAGASLAAVTLIYVFAPTFFIDGEGSNSSASTRKRAIVGLTNSANDCFINSILQSLAGLGQLRIFLIRETRRRTLEGLTPDTIDVKGKSNEEIKREGLETGLVTFALKNMLDSLNERPIYKKTISATIFVAALERAFRQRISRQQQDAQEFFQLVAERLSEEYVAARKLRAKRRMSSLDSNSTITPTRLEKHLSVSSGDSEDKARTGSDASTVSTESQHLDPEEGFPLEGKLEWQIECTHCSFKPKPTISTFVALTLNVPQTSSTTLGACFDSLFKVEHIDDFKCDACRLRHAIELRTKTAQKAMSEVDRLAIVADIAKLQQALDDDPEKPPEDVKLPARSQAPSRRIARRVRMLEFPRIVSVHLSRSIYAAGSYYSTKNSAKVSFPERLPLGGLVHRVNYKLLGVVTHKGSHNSGHYESFRRQNVYPPFSTPNSLNPYGAFNTAAPNAATLPSINELSVTNDRTPSPLLEEAENTVPQSESVPSGMVSTTSSNSTISSTAASSQSPTLSAIPPHIQNVTKRPVSSPPMQTSITPKDTLATTRRPHSLQVHRATTITLDDPETGVSATILGNSLNRGSLRRRKDEKKGNERWWRISDEKIKEARTEELLSFQREVYMLFYELEAGAKL